MEMALTTEPFYHSSFCTYFYPWPNGHCIQVFLFVSNDNLGVLGKKEARQCIGHHGQRLHWKSSWVQTLCAVISYIVNVCYLWLDIICHSVWGTWLKHLIEAVPARPPHLAEGQGWETGDVGSDVVSTGPKAKYLTYVCLCLSCLWNEDDALLPGILWNK
jgi:hypothetical protein